MRIDVITLFPGIFSSALNESILKIAQKKGLLSVHIHNLRDYCLDKHKKADDEPYGGGPGMVLKPEPIFRAVYSIKSEQPQAKVILTSPQGILFTQEFAKKLAKENSLIIICGHYEGVDERVNIKLVDFEISIGDYVLTGGELPALVIIDAIARLLPGVLGNYNSVIHDSFYNGILGYPQYTRPAEYEGLKVPEILLSGDHQKISRWRRKEALRKTLKNRPDLLERRKLSELDYQLLDEIKKESIESTN